MSHGATLSHQRWRDIERPACSVLCTRRSVCTALQPTTLSCIGARRAAAFKRARRNSYDVSHIRSFREFDNFRGDTACTVGARAHCGAMVGVSAQTQNT
jgi:hypothetical protein